MIQILFLFLLCAFYLTYFIKMLLLKKQGIAVDLLGKGEKNKKAARIELFLKIITVVGAAVQFVSVVFLKVALLPRFLILMQIIGIVAVVLGLIFFICSVIIMRNNWRAGFDNNQNTQLVTNGIYQISRNPAFVGFDLMYIGCALAFPNILNIIASLIAATGFHMQILMEEKFLTETFGKPYLDYKSKVRRYF